MNYSISRTRTTTSWRQTIDIEKQSASQVERPRGKTKKSRWLSSISSSNFVVALLITTFIIFTQLFIVNHYFGRPIRRQRLFSRSSRETNLMARFGWFCHSFPYLNHVAEMADQLQIELVMVDPDLLALLTDSERAGSFPQQLEFSNNGKSNQEASQKTVIHLAAINETSGGQPNLKIFLNALKEHYHTLEYQDASETMPAEVYKRHLGQLDDVQVDAMRDSLSLGQGRGAWDPDDLEISKIYTEFIAHVFLVSATNHNEADRKPDWRPKVDCASSGSGHSKPFVVLHLFVLYNYEFQPDEQWVQSSLFLNEIERHKLLNYGVHMIDFRVPLNQYYVHKKQRTSSLLDASGLIPTLKVDKPMNKLKVLQPDHLLEYANNTYLHCKRSSFNISALLDGNRRMSSYLEVLDAAKPLKASKHRAMLFEQVSIALKFMDVFAKSYGHFSFWLTGSTLLAYHKFCQLIAITPQMKRFQTREQPNDEDDLSYWLIDDYEEQVVNEGTILELELGLFENELNASMLSDLSEAKMIGVTMMTDWREPNKTGLISFHVKDCPNLVFNLHFYRLTKDFYGQYFVTNDNMIYNHKFRRRKSRKSTDRVGSKPLVESPSMSGHHVFAVRNLELCWTRLDHLEPFRVPCDVHDHLRRIFVV